MKAWRAGKRLLLILRLLRRYGLQEKLPRHGLWRLLHWGAAHPPEDYPRRLRRALEELGPLFVKLGQTLSTRPDLLPEDWLQELSLLQDRVPPFPGEEALATMETAWQQPWRHHLSEFSLEPLASASVAQVHAARLHSGEEVIVKILRPGIQAAVRQDLELMHILARMLQLSPEGKRLRPLEVVREFEGILAQELDLLNEAANASQLRAHFADSDLLYVPEIHWPACRRQILVMERIRAINIADAEALRAAGVNMRVLGERGVEIFFTQVFRDRFFHADMHPGNIFVDVSNPEAPRYCAIDFGIMGSLTPEDQHYLAENFLAFFNRDYRRVAELHIESGWVPRDTRLTDFEAAIRKVSEPIFGKPIKDISFGAFLLSLFQTARQFNMHIQPQLVLLQKTFFNVEGLGRRLYPELDLWTTAKPVLEDWMKSEIGLQAFWKRFRTQAHDYAKILPQLPRLTAQALQRQERPPAQPWNGGALLLSSLLLALYLRPPQSAGALLFALAWLALALFCLRRKRLAQ